MIYGSVCSGIEAATVAWHPLGWSPAFFSEIEAAPRAVLSHHYPEVPLHGDFTTIGADDYGAIDLLVGGTPCQSFSIAGLRGGMDDERGNLALEYLRLADRKRPRWLVWENVPGVLSSNGGRDFGSILGGMAECGYGFAYRVLNAQFFGVPQRRRRVFVVGYFGDWRPAAAVLFERHSLSGDTPPRREKGQRIADSLTVGANQCSGFPGDFTDHTWPAETAPTLNAAFGAKLGLDNQHTRGGAAYSSVAQCLTTGVGQRYDPETETLIPMHGGVIDVAAYRTTGNSGCYATGDKVDALTTGTDPNSHVVTTHTAVRRLTPRECERLQGFPDDYTLVPNRGKPMADGPRYKALGNSMAVPVMHWIGERIQMVEDLKC